MTYICSGCLVLFIICMIPFHLYQLINNVLIVQSTKTVTRKSFQFVIYEQTEKQKVEIF